jgi:hypothetical protein
MTYLSDAWQVDTGIKVRSDFRREAYDQVEEAVNPDVFVEPLIKLFGKEVNEGGFSDSRFDKSKDYKFQVAQQFLYIHRNKDKAKDKEIDEANITEGEVIDTPSKANALMGEVVSNSSSEAQSDAVSASGPINDAS